MDEFWSAFVPQLLASLLGAGAAVGAVYYGFWLQREATREDAVDMAVERVLVELADYVTRVRDYRAAAGVRELGRDIPEPLGHGIAVAIEILQIRTRKDDRQMALLMRSAWRDITKSKSSHYKQEASGHLAGAISTWRLGESVEETVESLRLVSRIAEKGIRAARATENEDLAE